MGDKPENTVSHRYNHTIIRPCEDIHELRVLAAALLSSRFLEWRHHGIGLLQCYVTDEWKPEVRIHIWHPDLLIQGMEKSGQIHNHRFSLKSTVLTGCIGHAEFNLKPSIYGAWQKWTVLNARKGAEPPQPADGIRYDADIRHGTIYAGETYEFPVSKFHKSNVTELAVTLVTKHDQVDTRAMILAPHDTVPVHGFDPDRPKPDMERYVEMALKALTT